MKLVDLNVLLYAVNRDSAHHEVIRRWWEDALSGDVPVGLAWVVLLGFLRLTTNPRILPRPLDVEDAVSVVGEWLAQPPVRPLVPTDRHWPILQDLLRASGAAGNLTTDAHLAALAIEHGATLLSTDTDFARFANLRWLDPLA